LPKDTTAHAGLWLDKYIRDQERKDEESWSEGRDGEKPKNELVTQVAGIGEPAEYKGFYDRWEAALKERGVEPRKATVLGRMVIGIGAESVLENAITLHRTYGVPVIPGSALKGLAAAYARQRLGDEWAGKAGEEKPAYETVFGTAKKAGYITFFDALYVPGSGGRDGALHSDVLTVHHPQYYQQGKDAPADWDSPVPIPFLSATGEYLIALAGPKEWVSATFEILRLALAEMGVGAKTSSGYGRMKLTLPERPGSVPVGSNQQASAPAVLAQPTAPARPLPYIGQKIKARVIEVNENERRLELPGYDPRVVIGILPAAALEGSPYPVNNDAAVEVIGVQRQGTGPTLVIMKRQVKKDKEKR